MEFRHVIFRSKRVWSIKDGRKLGSGERRTIGRVDRAIEEVGASASKDDGRGEEQNVRPVPPGSGRLEAHSEKRGRNMGNADRRIKFVQTCKSRFRENLNGY